MWIKIFKRTLLTIIISSLCFTSNLFSNEIIVSEKSPIKSINHAIQIAEAGDKIFIKSGYYAEGNIIVDKQITIIGTDDPVIDGKDDGEIFTVTADNVQISGLVIKNSGTSYLKENAGIRLEEVSNCRISNNKFVNNFFAIYLAKSSSCEISNNYIVGVKKRESNSGNGIHLWYCRDVSINNNTILNHRDGIYFEFVRNGRIRNNYSEGNLRYGLHFMFSDSCEYRENTFENNGAGVAVMYTKNVLMEKNYFRHNWGTASYGILLKDISDSKISFNQFEENTVGIFIEGCSRILVQKNDFRKNGWAIKLMANSMGNIFNENNFIANSFDVSTNSKQNFNTFEKNYWSSYSGYDLNKDGYGDVPFRPVTMFSMIVEKQPTSLILLNGLFIKLLDVAESIIPALTPEALTDSKPRMRMINEKSDF
ncbi:MAG: nitrous oxide reductase [Ignavibacteria bacterium RIFOXYB2_FULL_35_12]|nr:MAG: nitrous oxide reductase [Ignavibacteria bacterium GWA2_36_19]OGU52653.1 MAG: nitrous oxide reductase [Ignavibacteria bacterium GWC2_35_8]OGU59467.1 MAG: nitrous oxide reductase [Ignavibacteria bacterium GWF2_35_20]OGU79968.1 MAG: nitrous oxide reductase [Ignavibacteria bacterium RIFOXYA2_FULL_35_9]OGU85092.1 MAG: nitrous oxide reductase [Ignavibacteria bacterium RIFOXYA12_FULL_35_25]OGU89335.1 MAG: nitrous oxide reductase [Ignavibacteria bacterium RIFOXYC12_FULL_35_11]OGU93829.1 MAG: 